MPQEIEIKFRIADKAALRAHALELGFQLKTERSHETNALYDFPSGTLRRHSSTLRIRNYGGKWKLTFKSKGKAGKHKQREETETSVADGAALHAIFESLGLHVAFRYEKFRTELAYGEHHLVIDETPIGDLGELEGPPEWIDEMAAKLGIAESEYITGSYVALFSEWKKHTGSPARNMLFAECAAM